MRRYRKPVSMGRRNRLIKRVNRMSGYELLELLEGLDSVNKYGKLRLRDYGKYNLWTRSTLIDYSKLRDDNRTEFYAYVFNTHNNMLLDSIESKKTP